MKCRPYRRLCSRPARSCTASMGAPQSRSTQPRLDVGRSAKVPTGTDLTGRDPCEISAL
jgi:hypothetical protein